MLLSLAERPATKAAGNMNLEAVERAQAMKKGEGSNRITRSRHYKITAPRKRPKKTDAGVSETPETSPATTSRKRLAFEGFVAAAALERRMDEVTYAMAKRAQAGDVGAARLFLGQRSFVGTRTLLQFELRPIAKAEDVAAASGDIFNAIASGKITLDDAAQLFDLLQRALEIFAVTGKDAEPSGAASESDGQMKGIDITAMNEAIFKKLEEQRAQKLAGEG